MDKKNAIIRSWQAMEKIEMLARDYRGIDNCKSIENFIQVECDAEIKQLEAFCEQIEQCIFDILEAVYT